MDSRKFEMHARNEYKLCWLQIYIKYVCNRRENNFLLINLIFSFNRSTVATCTLPASAARYGESFMVLCI